MRIGIDVHAVERDGTGNCTYMRGLLPALARLGQSNEFVLYGTQLDHPFYATLRRLGCFQIHRMRPATAALRIPFTLAACSVRDRLDLLHVQYGGPPWLHGRLVSTIHDVAFVSLRESFAPFERLWMPRLIRFTARRAAVILTGSEFARQQVTTWAGVPRGRACVTYYGVGPSFVPVAGGPARDAVLQRYGIQPPFILSVGRLNARKNLERVLAAFERLAKPDLQLVIAGVQAYGSAVLTTRLQRSPRREAVRCVGFISDADLPAVLSAAAVFVYPSLFEGFGLPPLEAAACGTPVVASNTTALPEVLDDAALLVDPTDVDAIAGAVKQVLDDKGLRERLQQHGPRRAAQFSWEATAQQTLAGYRQALENGSGAALHTRGNRRSTPRG